MSAEMVTEADAAVLHKLNKARVLRMIYEGASDHAGATELEITLDEYQELRREAIGDEGSRIARLKPEEAYAEYVIQMRRLIEELLSIRQEASKANVFGAQVDAIKTAGMLLDKTMERGQSMGVINSASKKVEHLHAHLINQMDNKTVRATILHEVKQMERLVGSTPDKDFLDMTEDDVIDVEVVSIKDVESSDVEPDRANNEKTGRPPFARGGPGKVAGGKAVHDKKRRKVDDIDDLLGDL